eukprot:1140794-Pelagomonas_calceolata.AAC.1
MVLGRPGGWQTGLLPTNAAVVVGIHALRCAHMYMQGDVRHARCSRVGGRPGGGHGCRCGGGCAAA